MKLFITGRRQKDLDQAVAAIGGNVTGVLCNSALSWTINAGFESYDSLGYRVIPVYFQQVPPAGQ